MSYEGYKWFSGHDEELMSHGPFDNREDAIEEARTDASGEFQAEDGKWYVSVWVIEASNPPLCLSKWIDPERMIEHANEQLSESDRIAYEYDEGPFFEASKDQYADLYASIRSAVDEWQDRHGLSFSCRSFAHVRSSENVIVPHPGALS